MWIDEERSKKMTLNIKKVNLFRARKCMTITDLAKEYGSSRQRMQMILNQRNVTPVCAGRLAAALGVDVTEIIED